MSTPWTISKFIRWRVNDWRSCFLARRFPSEDEPDAYGSSSAPHMVFELRECNKTSKKMGKDTRRKERRRSSSRGSANVEIIGLEVKSEERRSWPCLHDEDYIVFCFGEGGQFDILDDDKSDELDVFESEDTSPKHANIEKLRFVDVEDIDWKSRDDEERLRTNRNCTCLTNETNVAPVNEDWEGASLDAVLPLAPAASNQQVEEEVENHGIISYGLGSSDGSNKSEGSSGSFSFPVLPWELIGSPVQMPKSESLHIRKHKVAKFQCCRF